MPDLSKWTVGVIAIIGRRERTMFYPTNRAAEKATLAKERKINRGNKKDREE